MMIAYRAAMAAAVSRSGLVPPQPCHHGRRHVGDSSSGSNGIMRRSSRGGFEVRMNSAPLLNVRCTSAASPFPPSTTSTSTSAAATGAAFPLPPQLPPLPSHGPPSPPTLAVTPSYSSAATTSLPVPQPSPLASSPTSSPSLSPSHAPSHSPSHSPSPSPSLSTPASLLSPSAAALAVSMPLAPSRYSPSSSLLPAEGLEGGDAAAPVADKPQGKRENGSEAAAGGATKQAKQASGFSGLAIARAERVALSGRVLAPAARKPLPQEASGRAPAAEAAARAPDTTPAAAAPSAPAATSSASVAEQAETPLEAGGAEELAGTLAAAAAAAATAGTVRTTLRLTRECAFGESFVVVGSAPALGSWDVGQAVALEWSEGHVWSADVDLPATMNSAFKVVLVRRAGEPLSWQPGPNLHLDLASAVSGGSSSSSGTLAVLQATVDIPWEAGDGGDAVRVCIERRDDSEAGNNAGGVLPTEADNVPPALHDDRLGAVGGRGIADTAAIGVVLEDHDVSVTVGHSLSPCHLAAIDVTAHGAIGETTDESVVAVAGPVGAAAGTAAAAAAEVMARSPSASASTATPPYVAHSDGKFQSEAAAGVLSLPDSMASQPDRSADKSHAAVLPMTNAADSLCAESLGTSARRDGISALGGGGAAVEAREDAETTLAAAGEDNGGRDVHAGEEKREAVSEAGACAQALEPLQITSSSAFASAALANSKTISETGGTAAAAAAVAEEVASGAMQQATTSRAVDKKGGMKGGARAAAEKDVVRSESKGAVQALWEKMRVQWSTWIERSRSQ